MSWARITSWSAQHMRHKTYQHKLKMRSNFRRLFLVLALLFLFGCSAISPPRYRSASVQRTARSVPEYQLGFGDVIEVKFFDNERFKETVKVRPDGRISLECIGDIFVAGMTPAQLDSLVTRTYAEIIQNPDVTIFVRDFGGYQVYVLARSTLQAATPCRET